VGLPLWLAGTHKHRRFYTQTLLHADAFTHRSVYTQTLLHTEGFTHRCFYTQTLLHTDTFTHRRFTHTDAFIHRDFYTQTLLHTEACTHRSFYTQTLSHTPIPFLILHKRNPNSHGVAPYLGGGGGRLCAPAGVHQAGSRPRSCLERGRGILPGPTDPGA